MIELKQFLLWILRKIAAAPKRWHDRLTEIYGHSEWIIPITAITVGVGFFGILIGILFAALGRNDIGAVFLIAICSVGGAFILSAAVRAMYREFKRDQRELINTLKQ